MHRRARGVGAVHGQRLRGRRRVDGVEPLGLLRPAVRPGQARAHKDLHRARAGERRPGVRARRGQRQGGEQGVQDQGEHVRNAQNPRKRARADDAKKMHGQGES